MSEVKKNKRKLGDRRDGVQIRDLDPMHILTPMMYPNRCDNEAFISERFDMAPIRAYCDKKNAEPGTLFTYTPFHVIAMAIVKILTLRPKMNRFVCRKLMYQRNEVSVSFVVKKLFSDDGAEGLAVIHAVDEDTVNTLHKKLYDQISFTKSENMDKSSEAMDIVSKFPVRLVRLFVSFIYFLDQRGKCPQGLIETDPYHTSCVLSNVGSIKLKSGYHHLTNWGTTSLFGLIGEIKNTIYIAEDGSIKTKETVDIGITVDERLADGYYYSKTVRLLKAILANPEVLELPMNQMIEY